MAPRAAYARFRAMGFRQWRVGTPRGQWPIPRVGIPPMAGWHAAWPSANRGGAKSTIRAPRCHQPARGAQPSPLLPNDPVLVVAVEREDDHTDCRADGGENEHALEALVEGLLEHLLDGRRLLVDFCEVILPAFVESVRNRGLHRLHLADRVRQLGTAVVHLGERGLHL